MPNPEWPLIEKKRGKVLPKRCMNMCEWHNGTLKCFEWSSRLEKHFINTDHLPLLLLKILRVDGVPIICDIICKPPKSEAKFSLLPLGAIQFINPVLVDNGTWLQLGK